MTLREIRLAQDRSQSDVAERVAALLGTEYTHRAVDMWEERGTQKYEILAALAQVYALPLDSIVAANRATQQGLTPQLPRGRKKRAICAISA